MAEHDDLKALQDLGLSEEQAAAVVNGPLKGLISKRDELLGSHRTLKQQLDTLKESVEGDGDLSAKTLRKKIQELENEKQRAQALAKEDYEAALEVDRKKFETERAALEAERDTLAKRFENLVVKTTVTDGALKAGVSQDYLDAAIALHRDRVTIADETPVIDGKPVADYFQEWVATDEGKRFAAAPRNSGAGAKGSGNGGPGSAPSNKKRSEMSIPERTAFIRDHGEEAYLKLPN